MKKVSLVIMDKTREDSLEKLRDLGIMHLEKRQVNSETLSRLLDRKLKAESALGMLKAVPVPKKMPDVSGQSNGGTNLRRRKTDKVRPEEFYSAEALDAAARPDLISLVMELAEEKKTLHEKFFTLTKERSRIEKWGDFDPHSLAGLAEKGIRIFLYELPHKVYGVLPEDVRLIVLGKDKAAVYAAVIDKEIPGEMPFDPGGQSLSEIDGAMSDIQDRLADIESRLVKLTDRTNAIETEIKKLDESIEFETAKGGMDLTEDAPSEYAVAWFSGFVPQDDVGILKRSCAEHGWALIADDPREDDEVPTLLKNNRLVSLIYPLTNFLEVLPGYREIDISGWFLLFFCVFFGMIFGDAGYGFLLLLIAVIGIGKTSKKGAPAGLKMLLLLSISNTLWGILTCTWFGIETDALPEILRRISLPLISGAESARSDTAKAVVDQNLQIFCFSLALIQLGIAHIKGIIRNIRSLKLFGELGSLAMLIGMFNVVLTLVVSNSSRQIPLLPLSLYLLAGGFFLSFVFAGYEGSIGGAILNSLKNIISVVLGVTNVFSDIMSYIRLWAVGLAGASISATVNQMAGPMLGSFLVFAGVILLVFGHGLNIVLNVLSVLVHGVRLNTLEFSGHLGLTWSGFAYKPFAKAEKS
ncbi:MAG: V-type ATP synthase subunit I [Treponema sp.]|jgi:V/A-type H+-transporting ATPase subunit I|nr:V-type ATP synthase subunit I [Treponema sp.]